MTEYALFVKRVLLTGVTGTIMSLKGLILLPILTKTLGASAYGKWILILTTIALIEPFIQFGLGASVARYLPSKNKKEIGQGIVTALTFSLFIGLIPCLLLLILSDTIAIRLFNDESMSILIKLVSPLLLLNSLIAISSNFFRITGQIKKESAVLLSGSILEVGVTIYFLLLGYGVRGLIIALLITKFVFFVITLYFIISYAGIAYPNFLLIPSYVKYGFPFITTAVFEIAIHSSDRYIIGCFLGTKSVGIYSAAYGVGCIISVISTFIMRILYPTISDLYDKGLVEEVKAYLSNTWKYMLMLYIPSVFGLAILSKQIISNLTTIEFAAKGAYIVPIIALSMVFYGIYGLYGGVISLLKKTQLFTIATIVSVSINIIINVIFMPTYGIMVAAISTLISYIICVAIISQKAYITFDKDYLFLGKCISSALIMTIFIWKFNPTGKTDILLSIVFGAVIYFSTLTFLKGLNRKELISILSNQIHLHK